MIHLNRAGTVVFVAALTFSGFACVPEPTENSCTTVADCGAAPGACVENTCVDKVCGKANLAGGTLVGLQTAGDCKASQCDGLGHAVLANDDSDVPADSQECTDDVCTAGVPSHPPRAADSACGAGGLLRCDGQGACISCGAPADCGASTECKARTCVAGACGVSNVARGTALASQTAGDCKASQCDGTGGTELINDDADVVADALSCTDDVCTAGVPSHPPLAARAACSEGTSTLCDGAGACVACVAATDCPGTDRECRQRTCTAGVCGFSFTAQNTPVASQTARDCKQSVCDGAGAVTQAADNTDLPDDNNACTTDTCVSGTPTFADATAGTTCGTVGVCSAGVCVGCVAPSDCQGSDDECKARTCVANVCGVSFTAVNTLVASQTPNNCRKSACDGSGNIVNQNDDADLPAEDGNQCTSQVCSFGVPSFPAVTVNTACTLNGGSFCSSAATCVACTAAAQCPGTDTQCQTRTCTNNTCGFNFAAAGFVTTAQTPNDCRENQCDGTGAIVAAIKNSDLPADDGNQCTDQVCNAGVPSLPPATLNTACGPGGGSFCNGTGTCVSCNTAAQCTGSDTECQSRTCTDNTCGLSFTPSGTATASQTANDCRENQCNGSGGTVAVNKNTDVPLDDGNQCTLQTCTAGAPTFPPAPPNTACNQNGGSVCDAAGACVTCTTASQCPGSDTECQTRTCTNNVCGLTLTPADTVTTAQTAGDCKQNRCDGAGAIVAVNQNSDLPADDGNQCTTEVCSAGVPSFPMVPVDTACNQNGGSFCDSSAACVACNVASQCTGADTDCRARTCTNGTCGTNFIPAGTATTTQTAGDCRVNQCDGTGSIVAVSSSADVPADDGNQCTSETCNAGVPAHPDVPVDTACNQNGGSFCSGSGSCVACNGATQCPGSDTECQTRTCTNNACGFNFAASGFVLSAQTAGDCRQAQCDGAGVIVSAAFNADLPVDGNQCTADVCTAGVASNPPSNLGTACSQSGGTICDGSGACVSPPTVVSTTPADGSTPVAGPSISVTFSTAMNPATLTGQTTAGACTGSIQVSLDNFANCVAFSSAAAVMSGGNTTATLTAAPSLLVNQLYKIRVTTTATGAVALAAQFTQANGFITASPNLCNGSLVISQVYGGGGLANATYRNDFVELHNRGTTTINLTGLSLQYTSTSGSAWASNRFNLTGSVAANGYYLVALGNGGGTVVGAALPAGDQSWSFDIGGTNGKLALVSGTTGLAANICPDPALTLDFVGYGSANCSEGAAAVPALSSTTAAARVQGGCGDVNRNASDFAVVAPAPRNSSAAGVACACTAQNESNAALEADYCTVQFPLSLSAQTGTATPLVFGQLFEAGVTEAAGANTTVRAQLGYGLVSSNPEYEAGWTWTNATFNVQSNNNDEYQASFTAPAVGTYGYVYRFSLDQGVSWTYCDANSGDFGAGSNANLTFELNQVRVLTVTQ